MTCLFIVALFLIGIGSLIGAATGSFIWGLFGGILAVVAVLLILGDDPE